MSFEAHHKIYSLAPLTTLWPATEMLLRCAPKSHFGENHVLTREIGFPKICHHKSRTHEFSGVTTYSTLGGLGRDRQNGCPNLLPGLVARSSPQNLVFWA